MITHLSLPFTTFDLFHELSTSFPEAPIFRQKGPDPGFHYSIGDGHRTVFSILLSKPSIRSWPQPESSWCLGMGPFLENESYKAEWNPRLILSHFLFYRGKKWRPGSLRPAQGCDWEEQPWGGNIRSPAPRPGPLLPTMLFPRPFRNLLVSTHHNTRIKTILDLSQR